jgi:hypothetical protein
MKAVEIDGKVLEVVSQRLKKEKKIVEIAVRNDGEAVRYADLIFRQDKEIAIITVK